jgi:hypothetical protein
MATTKITSPDLFNLESLDSALQLPSGTTAERPSSATSGEWRFNTDTSKIEFYDGSAWYSIEPASGGGGGAFSVENESYIQWVLLDASVQGVYYSEYADFGNVSNLSYSGNIFSSGYTGKTAGYNGTCWIVIASNGTDSEVARSFTGLDWQKITTISGANITPFQQVKWNGYSWAVGSLNTNGTWYNTNADGSGSWSNISAGVRSNYIENYNNTQWLRNINYDEMQVSTNMYPTSFTSFYNPSADDINGISVVNGSANFLVLYRGRPSASSNTGRELREWTSPTGSGTLVATNSGFGVGTGLINTAAGTLIGWNSAGSSDEFLTYDGSTTATYTSTTYGFDSGTNGRAIGYYNGTSTAFCQGGNGQKVSYRTGNAVTSSTGWASKNFFSTASAYQTKNINVNAVISSARAETPFLITDKANPETTAGTMDFLVQGGGGAGASGKSTSPYANGSGGGAGSMLTSYGLVSGGGQPAFSSITLGAGTYTVVVGGGGTGQVDQSGTDQAPNGANSSLTGPNTSDYKMNPNLSGDITAVGGGGGATTGTFAGKTGGCMGGLNSTNSTIPATYQGDFQKNGGFPGGYVNTSGSFKGGSGGGGVGMVGIDANENGGTSGGFSTSGKGGNGIQTYITGSAVFTGGGGGGGMHQPFRNYGPLQTTAGGLGGGGAGGGAAGGTNTGGGGGGGYYQQQSGGSGGSGVVVLRMKTSEYSGTTTGSPTVTTDGNDTVLTFTGSGTYVHS